MNTMFKKIWNIVSTAIVVLLVFSAIFLMGSRLIGYQCYNVISGSMEPKYSVGDLLYVKDVDPYSIKVGDPITFVVNEDLVVATHRVTQIDIENQRFYTKGDANEIEDAQPVHFNNVIGVPQFSIPKLGYVADFIQHPPGLYITIAIGIVLVLLVFVPDLIGKKKTDEKESRVEAQQDRSSAIAEENEKLKAELERLREEMADKKSE